MTIMKLALIGAVALMLPFGILLALTLLRRKPALKSARQLRRERLGGHLSDAMDRRVEQRVTETREPSGRLDSGGSRAVAKREIDSARLAAVFSKIVEELDWGQKAMPGEALPATGWRICAGCHRFLDFTGVDSDTCADCCDARETADALTREAQETGQDYSGGTWIPLRDCKWVGTAADTDAERPKSVKVNFTPETEVSFDYPGPSHWDLRGPDSVTYTASSGTTSTFAMEASDGAGTPRKHPLGWTVVSVTVCGALHMCAVNPSGERVDRFHYARCAWEPVHDGFIPGGSPIARAAREALGRSA